MKIALVFFQYDHLPEHLQAVSRPFGELAIGLFDEVEPGPQRDAALHYLLLAKDAAVRAKVKPGL